MNPSHAIQILWKHAAPSLTVSDLAHLACAEDSANALRNLAQVTETLGRLVTADHGGPLPPGEWDGGEGLPGVLFGLASAIAIQAELVAVASDAAAMLQHRGPSGAH